MYMVTFFYGFSALEKIIVYGYFLLGFSALEKIIVYGYFFIGFSALEKIIVYGYFFLLVLVPWRRSLYIVTFFYWF